MPTGSAPRRGEAGYTLAVLIGILAVLAIALGAAVPHWVANVQREKEAELVARGLQYAEAIRVFQRRFGRLPNTLDELVEIEPRSIRRLWRNPFAEGDAAGWAVLMEVAGGQVAPVDPATGAVLGGTTTDGGIAAGTDLARAGDTPSFGTLTGVAGPIHGVRSAVRGEAYRSFFGQKEIGDWEFSVERLVAATGALSPTGTPRRADYASIGRAFPFPPPGGEAGASPQAPPAGGAPGEVDDPSREDDEIDDDERSDGR